MYVIAGASGNTGTIVANKLLSQGKKVRVLGRNADHLSSFVAKGAESFVGDLTDKAAMTKAFEGAQAVYVLIPPKVDAPDFFAYQKQVQEALATSIGKNNVKYAVLLSSVGAEKTEKTGPILGLHRFEQRLNAISGLNVLYLRPAYFMENILGQVEAIAQMRSTVGMLRPEIKFAMIATRDIGAHAADALSSLDFKGQQVRDLQGERDISFGEITSIIGKAIGKPDLPYLQLTGDQFGAVLLQMGMSKNMSDLLVEMAGALDSGYIKPMEPRSARNTTATSFETFVAEVFLPVYQKKLQAA